MRFFDLVVMQNVPEPLCKRLGYSKIFSAGKDVGILENAAQDRSKVVIRSDNLEAIVKGLRQNNVIGLLPKNVTVSRKAIEVVKESEKIVLLPLCEVTKGEDALRAAQLAKMRKLVRSVLIAKAPFALVSLADNRENLISSLQMTEVAGFLGIPRERAKSAMGIIGDLL